MGAGALLHFSPSTVAHLYCVPVMHDAASDLPRTPQLEKRIGYQIDLADFMSHSQKLCFQVIHRLLLIKFPRGIRKC